MKDGFVFDTVTSGKAQVVRYKNAKNVLIRFLDTGFEVATTSRCIRSGNIKDYYRPNVLGVGFKGVGKHDSHNGRNQNIKYSRWHGMLERCYSARYQELKPTYIGCKVCDEWHNFQVFAEWFEVNYIEGFELDKDKLGDGKLYSPETCCFISRTENVEISQAKRYVLRCKDGTLHEFFNLSKFCRDNNLTSANVHKVLNKTRSHHKGWKLP